jgi:indoleamine 2,3-dioxygenase
VPRQPGVLERVHSLFGYVGKGYVHGSAAADGAQRVPAFLGRPWLCVSARLRRHPTIDYADCVLYNWERIDADGPMTPENVRLLNRFTGLLDEERQLVHGGHLGLRWIVPRGSS